jgi:hypothetical protein
MAFTAVMGMAFYQVVVAVAANNEKAGRMDFWAGVLVVSAVAVLLLPILAIPFIFGGISARPLVLDGLPAPQAKPSFCPFHTQFGRDSWRRQRVQPVLAAMEVLFFLEGSALGRKAVLLLTGVHAGALGPVQAVVRVVAW